MRSSDTRPGGRISSARHWTPVISLGLYTITAYGTWAYAFGVLIESIKADTGWSTSFLGAIYGASMALTGISAFWSGRLLDRFGPLVPLGLHAVVASGLLLAAFEARHAWLFALLFAGGAGLSGSTGFYTMTTVIAARARPERPDQAIAVLTVVGAFCSPIYLPATAWLLTVWHWRSVGRALILTGVVGAAQAMVIVRAHYRKHPVSSDVTTATTTTTTTTGPAGTTTGSNRSHRPSTRSFDALSGALVNPVVRRALTVYFLAGAAASTVWAYQVPILEATGLSLAAAGTFGGLRGFFQLFGRMGLTTAVDRFGSARLLQAAYLATAVGSLALIAGGAGWLRSTWVTPAMLAVVFAVTAGTGFGASSPLQAIHARLHFDPGDLGLLMGLQGAVLGLAGGLGPVAGSIMRDVSGSWTITVSVVMAILLISAYLLNSPVPTDQPPEVVDGSSESAR